ncbi:hypothetical protein ACWEFL_28040 [Streptomyces sp. NPDC004838]
MSSREKNTGLQKGAALYHQLFGKPVDASVAAEFEAMKDTPMNRSRLAYIVNGGGDRGRAAAEKLGEWEGNGRPPAA